MEDGGSIDVLIAGLQATSHLLGGSLSGAKTAAKISNDTSVYRALGDKMQVIYVGITKRFNARAAEHAARKGLSLEKIPGLEKLSRADAKAAEQALIELHGLGKNGGSLMNLINSIARNNPAYAASLKRGMDLLKQAGYPGI